MADYLKLTIFCLGRVCSRVTSAKSNIHLDQNLCSELAGFLKLLFADVTEQLSIVRYEISQHHPDMFKELYRVAYRAHILVERCCEEKWWRIVFTQACTSHSEEALDVIDDLEWCIAEISKIANLPKQPSQVLHHFKESFKKCEELDRSRLLRKLENQVLDLGKRAVFVPLARNDLQLSGFLHRRIRVQVVPSTPGEIEDSLDYRSFNLQESNGCPESRCLGEGSSGSVKLTDFLSIQCARKDQKMDSGVQLQEFKKQSLKLSKLSHPHVIKLFGFYTKKRSDQSHKGCLLMELMNGSLYREKMKLIIGSADDMKNLFQYRVAVDVMIQIAKGVRYLHENDVAHRDLKCDNILVGGLLLPRELASTAYKDYFHIKVTDFDQAKFFTSNSSDPQLQSKPNVGTTAWRAPEAYTERGKGSVVKVHPKRADSYSFAMTCYEILFVGFEESPFDAVPGMNLTEKKKAIVAGTRPPIPGGCPELLRDLIEDCWRKEALERPDFDEICRRLQDVRSVLLTGTLSQRNRVCDSASSSLRQHNIFGRVMSVFKHMMGINAVNVANNKRIPALRAIMPGMEAPFMHSGITEAVRQTSKDDLFPKQEHETLTAIKVVVGLDFGTTHSGVAYAIASNPDEIHTISHWPSVGEEVYHYKTLTAMCRSTPNGAWVWGYPARQKYGRHGRRNGQDIEYFNELKQSLTKNEIGSDVLQPVVEYLRELGNFVLGYLQRTEYPQDSLIMDHLRWCVTVPTNWSRDSKERFSTCLVNAGLVRGQAEDETYSSTFDMFLESDAAARHCYNYFSRANLEKGDRICVLDVGSGNVQCVFEDWDDAERAQNIYGESSSSAESLVEKNFLKFICGKDGHSLNADPSLSISILDELESLKADPNHFIKIPCRKRKRVDSNDTDIHLDISTAKGCQCDLNMQFTIESAGLSSLDRESIFKPLVDEVVTFLQDQLQKTNFNVKRLFVVGGYAKHGYLMKEIRRSFSNFVINTPRNPGSAVCKGAVALGLMLYSQFQARTQQDSSSNSEGGGQETNLDGGTRDVEMNQRGQPGSSQKFDPSIPRPSSAADSKGKKKVSAEAQMDVDHSLPEKMLVALDFGTSQMGFAYSRASRSSNITVCEDHQRRTTDLYYELQGDTLRLRSCGQKAKDDCRDVLGRDVPAIGEHVSKPKLHVVVDDVEPELELRLPTGLIIDDVISDCLREYGEFILQLLQEKFGKVFELQHIQWCLLVPSFWGENAKRQMKACMIKAGLLRGASNVDGSPYPLVTVLEAEAASIACICSLSLRKDYKFMVASIGGGTLDMVIQEWIGEAGIYDMKEAIMGAGGLCGSSCLDLNFLSLLSMKICPWISDYVKRHSHILNNLMSQWEQIKVEFSNDYDLDQGYTLHFPMTLQIAWRHFEQISTSGRPRESYELLQLTSDDLKMVFQPVVQTILELIAAQLARTRNVDALVLVGGFAKSSYLSGHIKYRFRDQVETLVRLADSDSAVLKGAVSFGLHPIGIRSRIARKTYGLGMSMDFQAGLHSAEDQSIEVERFRIDVEKGSRLEVDYCVRSVHKPLSRGQKNMKFSLYSSVESYPRYTEEESVTKEWDFVVDISDSAKSEEEPQIRIVLYYGRSAIEVEAEALNFGDGNPLPVTIVVGAMSESNAVVASVARKTYGVGARKALEKWDLPKYVAPVSGKKFGQNRWKADEEDLGDEDEEDLCDFSFETYIRKGTRLDYFASRTLFPIYNKQQLLPFKLYSSSEMSPVYVTDDVVMEEGALEIDIRKGLYLDKDREVSVRMWFSRTDIKISAVALNFTKPEDRNLPIRLRDGKWESQVTLNLARHLRVVPLQSGTNLCQLQPDSKLSIVYMDEERRDKDMMQVRCNNLGNWPLAMHVLKSPLDEDGNILVDKDLNVEGETIQVAGPSTSWPFMNFNQTLSHAPGLKYVLEQYNAMQNTGEFSFVDKYFPAQFELRPLPKPLPRPQHFIPKPLLDSQLLQKPLLGMRQVSNAVAESAIYCSKNCPSNLLAELVGLQQQQIKQLKSEVKHLKWTSELELTVGEFNLEHDIEHLIGELRGIMGKRLDHVLGDSTCIPKRVSRERRPNNFSQDYFYEHLGAPQNLGAYQHLGTPQSLGAYQHLDTFQSLRAHQRMGANQYLGTRHHLGANQYLGTPQSLEAHQYLDTTQSLRTHQHLGTPHSLGAYQHFGTSQSLRAKQYLSPSQSLEPHQHLGAPQSLGAHQYLGTPQSLGEYKHLGTPQSLGALPHLGAFRNIGLHEHLGTPQSLRVHQHLDTSQNMGANQHLGTQQNINNTFHSKHEPN